jgi:hypothetical protein
MPNCIQSSLERAQQEYEALEDRLKAEPEFRAYLESLHRHQTHEAAATLQANAEFRQWLALASLIVHLHRARYTT